MNCAVCGLWGRGGVPLVSEAQRLSLQLPCAVLRHR